MSHGGRRRPGYEIREQKAAEKEATAAARLQALREKQARS